MIKFFLEILAILAIIVVVTLLTTDDVEEIDNTDGHIICGNTEEPCIKDKLYTKCNNCNDCIYFDE